MHVGPGDRPILASNGLGFGERRQSNRRDRSPHAAVPSAQSASPPPDLEPRAPRRDARGVLPTQTLLRRAALPLTAGLAILFATCTVAHAPSAADQMSSAAPMPASVHAPLPTESRFCATCHPAIYAEHAAEHARPRVPSTARRGWRRVTFRREDCIRCHTPRPVFETGIGMTPIRRYDEPRRGQHLHDVPLRRPAYDYSDFHGGPECKTAFDPRVGTVADCATCHRIAGTPEQWSRAPTRQAGRARSAWTATCRVVERPVAVGEPPRLVRSPRLPGSRTTRAAREGLSLRGVDRGQRGRRPHHATRASATTSRPRTRSAPSSRS